MMAFDVIYLNVILFNDCPVLRDDRSYLASERIKPTAVALILAAVSATRNWSIGMKPVQGDLEL